MSEGRETREAGWPPLTDQDLAALRRLVDSIPPQKRTVAELTVDRLLDEVTRLRAVLNGPHWHSHPGTDLQHGPRPVKRDDGLWWHQHPPTK